MFQDVEANEEVSDTEIQSENEEEEINEADSEIASDGESISDDRDNIGIIGRSHMFQVLSL